jgi:hypothetical protein
MAGLTYEMRGPAGIRHAVCEFLRADLPRRAEACRDAWDLLDEELPLPVDDPNDPKRHGYFAREPAAIDRWPLIAVTSGRRSQREFDRDDDGSPVFRATYPVRVWSWVRDSGFDATLDLRDNLMTCIQVAVLSNVTLGSVGGRLQMTPASLVADPSQVRKVEGDRFVAGSFVGFDLVALETLTDRLALPGAQPRDTVRVVTAESDVLPPHPALL